MRVLYLIHQYFPYFYTGTELLTANLSTYERLLGANTQVWTYNLEEKDVKKVENTYYKGVPVSFFSHRNDDKDRDWKFFKVDRPKREFFKKLLDKAKPDVIHITQAARMGDIVQVAQEMGIPYIVTITDYWLLCPTATLIRENGDLCLGTKADPNCLKLDYKNNEYMLNERWTSVKKFLANSSNVVYASKFLRSMFEKNGIDTKDWINVRHGYNATERRVRVKDGFFRFGYTGTLQPSKGAHLVIEAFKKIQNTKARLVIYGELKHDLDYSNYCLKLAKGDSRIEFRGRYDHTKLVEEFKDIDCILVPSNWFEPFPFTLISAISYGFDVIGARIGGIPEIIGEKNIDSLFEPGDIEELSEKMLVKLNKGKDRTKKLFYGESLEAEAFKYFQLYSLVSGA